LTPAAPWRELSAEPGDWALLDPATLRSMLSDMHLIRAFEEKVVELAAEGLMHGPAHTSIGQEGAAVASMVPLRSSDRINGSHRGHHQFLAKALRHVGSTDLLGGRTADAATSALVSRAMAEIMGLAPGFCGGRGGSMHLRWQEAGALGTNAIVGGGCRLQPGQHGRTSWRGPPMSPSAISATEPSTSARCWRR
jgi:2-oxoisovalerate dehydrogenase E1 component